MWSTRLTNFKLLILKDKDECNIPSRKVTAGPHAGNRVMGASSHESLGLYSREGDRKYLNRSERRLAIEAFGNLATDKSLYALTLAWTGARASEVLALSPASFQIEAGLVSFRTLKQCGAIRVREVPLPPDVIAALDAHFDLHAAQRDPDLAHRRLWPFCRQTAWRIIKRAAVRAGLSGRAASPRGLRHAFGVGTLQATVPLTLLQRWMGHARLSTTAIYTAASGPEEISFADRFWEWGRPDAQHD